MTPSPILDVKNLAVIRNEQCLLQDINIQLAQGQMLLIEGANGSGKTTLLRTLCGLIPIEAGQINWLGGASQEDAKASWIYCGHKHAIKLTLSVLENITTTLAINNITANNADIEQSLEKFGLAKYKHIPSYKLSAGLLKRVSLLKLGLIKRPIWILDEPFTNLDKQGMALIQQCITEHLKQKNVVILSSHHTFKLPSEQVVSLHLTSTDKSAR